MRVTLLPVTRLAGGETWVEIILGTSHGPSPWRRASLHLEGAPLTPGTIMEPRLESMQEDSFFMATLPTCWEAPAIALVSVSKRSAIPRAVVVRRTVSTP